MPNYAPEDYLTDDSFIQWVLNPNNELDVKWNRFVESNLEEKERIDQAKEMLLAIYTQTISEYEYEINDEKTE